MRASGVGVLAAVLLAGALAGGAYARATPVEEILTRCGSGQSVAGFTVKQYHEALHSLPTDSLEYEECAEVIFEAEQEAARRPGHGGTSGGRKGSGTGGGGGTIGSSGAGTGGSAGGGGATGEAPPLEPTAEEQQAVAQAQSTPPAPVRVGSGAEAPLSPGVVHASVGSAFSSLPTALLAALAALVVLILGTALFLVRQRLEAADREA